MGRGVVGKKKKKFFFVFCKMVDYFFFLEKIFFVGDGQTDGRTDGRTDGQKVYFKIIDISILIFDKIIKNDN